jgi:hypothetical protein
LRSGQPVQSAAPAPAPTEPGFVDRIASDINTRGKALNDTLSQPASTPSQAVALGTKATATAFGAITNVLGEAIKSIPGGQQALAAIGGVTSSAFKALTDKLASTNFFKEAAAGLPANNALENNLSTASSAGELANTILAAGGVPKTAQTAADLSATGVKNASRAVSNTADDAFKVGHELKNKIQVSIADKTVNPQLKASADRLFLDGTKRIENPITTYDDYLTQSKKALTDIHADPAISSVGNEMGDAFNSVIKQRRAVGKTIGDELNTVGNLKVSIAEPKTSLLSELKDSGLSYNSKTKQLNAFSGTKFASEELTMLNNFVGAVQRLGDTPSVASIDNFISKTRSDLNFAKGKSGVIGTTNAERIINGALKGLRESLNPSKNQLPELAKYWKANDTYSQLSDFVDEGAGYLGKLTQSGDFAKDASVAKSAVQSILNNGKKDWMIKLEALTGFPALDKSVLALQAMKDAGDFRGLSLLQAMSEGVIPTSQAGFTQKMLDYAVAHGAQLVAGTPEEQTRAFLSDLLKKSSQQASPKTR